MTVFRALRGLSWRASRVWRWHLASAFRRGPLHVLSALLAPALVTCAAGLGLAPVAREVVAAGARVPYGVFLLPGVALAVAFVRGFHGGLVGGHGRLVTGTRLEATLATPLTLADAGLGEILWGTTAATASAGIAVAAAPLAGLAIGMRDVLSVALAAVVGFLASSLGLALATLCRDAADLATSALLVEVPTVLFSGAWFPLDALPAWAARTTRMLPLGPFIELARSNDAAGSPGRLMAALAYPAALVGVCFVSAIVLLGRRRGG